MLVMVIPVILALLTMKSIFMLIYWLLFVSYRAESIIVESLDFRIYWNSRCHGCDFRIELWVGLNMVLFNINDFSRWLPEIRGKYDLIILASGIMFEAILLGTG